MNALPSHLPFYGVFLSLLHLSLAPGSGFLAAELHFSETLA